MADISQIKDGDILRILGEDDNGNQCDWYAEKVGVNDDGLLEVYYIEPTSETSSIWMYPDSEQIHLVSIDSVQEHASSYTKGGYKSAWKKFGFRYVRDENDKTYFIDLSYEEDNSNPNNKKEYVPIGEDDSDSDSEHEDENESSVPDDVIDSEMEDFIVLDADGEEFTLASDDSEFTASVHDSVRKFNDWNPTDASEKKIKSYIEALDKKVIESEDERVFNSGNKPVNYLNPSN